MNIIIIVGPGAVGKMTVGQELSKLIRYPLLYNHMTIEPVRDLFGEPIPWDLVMDIRDCMIDKFLQTDHEGLIFTTMLNFDEARDFRYINKLIDKFDDYYIVELYAPFATRLRRNLTPHRLECKPSKRNIEASVELIKHEELCYRLTSDPTDDLWENYLRIDNETLSPQEAAQLIKESIFE